MYVNKQTGMTLVEMLVVIGIFTLLSGAIYGTIQALYQYNGYAYAQAAEVDNARRGLNTFSRDVREMTYAEDGSFPIVLNTEYLMGFYSDIDKDNNVEYVEYELATTTMFYKRVYNPTGNPPTYDFNNPDEEIILSEYVQNIQEATSTFQYFDSNGVQLDETSLLTDIRYIRAQIIVNIDPVRSPGEFLLRTSIAPRNLKDNL